MSSILQDIVEEFKLNEFEEKIIELLLVQNRTSSWFLDLTYLLRKYQYTHNNLIWFLKSLWFDLSFPPSELKFVRCILLFNYPDNIKYAIVSVLSKKPEEAIFYLNLEASCANFSS